MIALLKFASAVMGIGVIALTQYRRRTTWHNVGLAMTLVGVSVNIGLALISP